MTDRPHLHTLAGRAGILPHYYDLSGKLHPTSDASRVMLLAAMGLDGESEESAAASLARLDAAAIARMIPAASVVHPCHLSLRVQLHREVVGEPADWFIGVRLEGGDALTASGRLDPQRTDSAAAIELAMPPAPLGYHELALTVRSSRFEKTTHQRLIVVPERCRTLEDLPPASRRVFGICANLYTLRTASNWGFGDLSDLCDLCDWAARHGAAFIGLNPLHALRNSGYDVSPYSPVSRLFRNVMYIDITAVPEFSDCRCARQYAASRQFQASLHELRGARSIDYERVLGIKMPVLRELWWEFRARHVQAATDRGQAFAEFRARRGPALSRYATFCALEAHFAERYGAGWNWRRWPAEYRSPASAAVADFQAVHEGEIAFYEFLQFEVDRQLAAAAGRARASGMSIGLYQDLAIGTAANGSDTWANQDLFVIDARIGAPPDDYSATGQDWGLPPIHPLRLADTGFEHWRQLLQANFAHAGALRIDHVMGLLRQYWIPPGATALEGAYVQYPAEELFGILALESRRNNAVVIGEDLGTVPEGFSDLMERWGVLSCKVMYFQRDRDGSFLPESAYPPRSLVTSTTHDHVSLAGFFAASDLKLRRGIGSIEDDRNLSEELARREADCRALLRRVGLSAERMYEWSGPAYGELLAAVHRFLSRTPAALVGLMLDDLAGELEPVNVPGVPPERHPSWSRAMSVSLEQLRQSDTVWAGLRGAAGRVESY